MSSVDKRALREAAEKATPGAWVEKRGEVTTEDYEVEGATYLDLICECEIVGTESPNAEFIAAANPVTVLALLDELEESEWLRLKFQDANCELCQKLEVAERTSAARLGAIDTTHKMFQRERDRAEAAEKRIAELEASHDNLREAMAGIHNTITGGGAHTPLAAILNASKRAYEESAAAAGKGEVS